MLAGEVGVSQASAGQKSHEDMIQRDELCPGRSYPAWPFILGIGWIERVQGPSLISTIGRRGYDRLADGV